MKQRQIILGLTIILITFISQSYSQNTNPSIPKFIAQFVFFKMLTEIGTKPGPWAVINDSPRAGAKGGPYIFAGFNEEENNDDPTKFNPVVTDKFSITSCCKGRPERVLRLVTDFMGSTGYKFHSVTHLGVADAFYDGYILCYERVKGR